MFILRFLTAYLFIETGRENIWQIRIKITRELIIVVE